MTKRRVVITGMGIISALGHNVKTTWAALVAGRTGIDRVTAFDTTEYQAKMAAEVKDWEPSRYMSPKEARRIDRSQQFAIAAAEEALAQSGLEVQEDEATRVGVIIGSAVGGVISFQNTVDTLRSKGPRRLSPFGIPSLMPNAAANLIAIKIGARGPAFSVTAACATGTDSIGQAFRMIRDGYIDVAITGGTEATVFEAAFGSFDRMGALSRINDVPARTPRPFDKDRDGFVMGEGAAILVLETLEHARARGAEPLAEVIGYGSSVDAYHMTAPHPEGRGVATAMGAALKDAGLNPSDVDYINAHGTGTQLNDIAETHAIKAVFGNEAYRVVISSTKSMLAHSMGATGAMEAIFCVMAIRENIIPPTINLDEPDPECDLDYNPGQARRMQVSVAMSNSLGFGGQNATILLREITGN